MDPYVNIYGFNWFHLRIITVKIFKAKGLESIYLLQLNRLYSENSRKRVCFARLFLCFPCVLFGTTLWYALLFCLLFFVKCLLFYRLTARKAELNFFFYWILNLFHKEELFERPFFSVIQSTSSISIDKTSHFNLLGDSSFCVSLCNQYSLVMIWTDRHRLTQSVISLN